MKKYLKVMIICILLVVFMLFISLFYMYNKNEDKVAILGYHGILPEKLNDSGDNLIVDAEKFEQELKLLKK